MSNDDSGDSELMRSLDELEISVHYTISEDHPFGTYTEYEIHPGTADVLHIPEHLAETVLTVTGVDIRKEDIRCAAEIKVVENDE